VDGVSSSQRMFVHRIDPVIGQISGVYLWWYGLSYALGFIELHLWFRWRRDKLGFTLREVWDVTLLIPLCVVIGGRAVEVAFYEWPYYSKHLDQIPMLWLGGMSTHGLLLGAAVGTSIFCLTSHKSFVRMADELVIPVVPNSQATRAPLASYALTTPCLAGPDATQVDGCTIRTTKVRCITLAS